MSIGDNRRRVVRTHLSPDDYIDGSRQGVSFLILHIKGIWAKVIPLKSADSPVTIGRSKNADLDLKWDACCSKKHARLSFRAGEWRLRDHDSRNGIRINGELIEGEQDIVLRHNDGFRIGKTDFVFWNAFHDPPTIEVIADDSQTDDEESVAEDSKSGDSSAGDSSAGDTSAGNLSEGDLNAVDRDAVDQSAEDSVAQDTDDTKLR